MLHSSPRARRGGPTYDSTHRSCLSKPAGSAGDVLEHRRRVRREPWLVPLEWLDLGRPVPQRPRPRVDQGDVEVTDLGVLVAAIRDANDTIGGPHSTARGYRLFRPGDHQRAPRRDRHRYRSPTGAMGGRRHPSSPEQRAEVIDFATFGHKLIVGASHSGRTGHCERSPARSLRTCAATRSTCTPSTAAAAASCPSLTCRTVARWCSARSQNVPCACWGACWTRSPDGRRLAAGGYANLTEQRLACHAGSDAAHRPPARSLGLASRSLAWTVGETLMTLPPRGVRASESTASSRAIARRLVPHHVSDRGSPGPEDERRQRLHDAGTQPAQASRQHRRRPRIPSRGLLEPR